MYVVLLFISQNTEHGSINEQKSENSLRFIQTESFHLSI